MSLLLAVDPRSYQVASTVFGSQIADALTETGGRLTGALAGLTGMAGADATGASWAAAYNPLCADTVGAVEDAINGCLRLGALLLQTGFNHALADARSAGDAVAESDHASYDREVFLGAAPLVRGSAGHAPHGWGIVAHVVGHAWPGGHQDQLRAAAVAWASAGDRVHAAGELVGFAVDAVRAQLSPETDDAVTVCVATRAQLFELAGSCRVLGRACAEYADALDHAHSRIEHELAEFLAWSAVIEFGGLALAVFSAGASEGGAQAVEAGRIAATGARIAAILAEFGPAVARAGAHLAELADTVAGVRAALRALRDRPVVDASADILAVPGPAQRALDNLAEASSWANPETLADHFRRHGKDFAAASPAEYVALAAAFFSRRAVDRLPTKVDGLGRIRVYDPRTNTFGSYTSTGAVITFFKPTSQTYFERQPGVLQ